MNHWQALRPHLPKLATKLDTYRPPLLRVVVDDVTVLVTVLPLSEALEAHSRFSGMPSLTLEDWLDEMLKKLERLYPYPSHSVEVHAQWPGNPPRLERMARIRPIYPSTPRPQTLDVVQP
ncbi:hypothetical protein [Meiothermus sp. CFH 77666]|uniref:hypothetical protein n=1 Tax=Meiothermus sp. CFH 77666 TaxID=2817942 RepID=UPI001AA076AA|nr:hypothetical protein [Meiothermus sp. CFH 77666]MBO1436081.1 hypothetical protein [Meiothermus sp. CFH 77666]